MLRQAQTEFDKQSHALNEARAQHAAEHERAALLSTRCEALEAQLLRDRAVLDELKSDPTMLDARRLDELSRASEARGRELQSARGRLLSLREKLERESAECARRAQDLEAARAELSARGAELLGHSGEAGMGADHEHRVQPFIDEPEPEGAPAALHKELHALGARRAGQVARVQELLRQRGLEREIRTAAITYDPWFDTPDRMRRYAEGRGVRLSDDHRMLRTVDGMDAVRQYFELGVNYHESIVNRHRLEVYVLAAGGEIVSRFLRMHWDEAAVVDRAMQELASVR